MRVNFAEVQIFFGLWYRQGKAELCLWRVDIEGRFFAGRNLCQWCIYAHASVV